MGLQVRPDSYAARTFSEDWDGFRKGQNKQLFGNKDYERLRVIVSIVPPNDTHAVLFYSLLRGMDAKNTRVLDQLSRHRVATLYVHGVTHNVNEWDHPAYITWQEQWNMLRAKIGLAKGMFELSSTWLEQEYADKLPKLLEELAFIVCLKQEKERSDLLVKLEDLLTSDRKDSEIFIKKFKMCKIALFEHVEDYLNQKETELKLLWKPIRYKLLVNVIKTWALYGKVVVRIQEKEDLIESLRVLETELGRQLNLDRCLLIDFVCSNPTKALSAPKPIQNIEAPIFVQKREFKSQLPNLQKNSKVYETLKQLTTGDKLQLDYGSDRTRSLVISPGNNQSMLGWIVQVEERNRVTYSASLSYYSGNGFTVTDRKTIINFLLEICGEDAKSLKEIDTIIEKERIPLETLKEIIINLEKFDQLRLVALAAFKNFTKDYGDACNSWFPVEMSLQIILDLLEIKKHAIKALMDFYIQIHHDSIINTIQSSLTAIEDVQKLEVSRPI